MEQTKLTVRVPRDLIDIAFLPYLPARQGTKDADHGNVMLAATRSTEAG